GNSSAIGWLNFIEVNARRHLVVAGDQMAFRDAQSVGSGNAARYQLSGCDQSTMVWNVTYPTHIKIQDGSLNGSTFEFNAAADTLNEYIAFNGSNFFKPYFIEQVINQNLHSLPQANMLIVTNPRFKNEAADLASFHRDNDGLTVNVVTTKQVYNEFSCGSPDITAIKDFVKMFYERAGTDSTKLPRYLCLFGDGSYDNKHRLTGNLNLVPTYESAESLMPTSSYVSDDYYGLLDNNEGDSPSQLIDIGIGRIPVKSITEAQNIVKKIKHYYNKQTMKPWRNWLAFVGDDEDNSTHMKQSDQLAQKVDTLYPDYNIDKLYLDSYTQESTPGGERYPDVNAAINKRMEQGCLILTYVGHGGELGWAHERVLEVSDINSWTNIDNMPLFLTATCEFSRWDDPLRTSAGEYCFLNKDGGAIALLTTTRLVYSNPNKQLADTFFNYAFSELNGEVIRLGDLTLLTKINGPLIQNTRNFTLLGDPAVQLAYPRYNVVTTSVQDTIRALSKVTVSGYISDPGNGQKIVDFNGVIYPV
ncbi:MAG: type IX secretion system sortase PorU, partial [Flavobacteriales bacterium]